MVTKVQKWGNSQGIRFAKAVLEDAQIRVGDEVSVTAESGRIVIEPLTKVRGRYDLKDLVSRMPKGYRAREADWGEPVGKEAW